MGILNDYVILLVFIILLLLYYFNHTSLAAAYYKIPPRQLPWAGKLGLVITARWRVRVKATVDNRTATAQYTRSLVLFIPQYSLSKLRNVGVAKGKKFLFPIFINA